MEKIRLFTISLLSLFLLLAGGCNNSFRMPNFTPGSSTTSTTVYPIFAARSFHTATLLNNGSVLLVGGEDNNSPLNLVELYDPAQNTITTKTSLATSHSYHSATLLDDGKVLVAGGYDATWNPAASVEIYNSQTDTWFQAAPLNFKRGYHSATLLSDGKVLVAGGYDENWDMLDSSEIYDPDTDTWTTTVSTMGQGKVYHEATVLQDGRILIVGGQTVAGSTDSVEIFDPLTLVWSAAAPLSISRNNHSLTLLPNGRVLAVGGDDIGGNILNTAEIYNPVTDGWTAAAALSGEVQGHTATLLLNGKVAVIGGSNNLGNYPQAIQIYDSVANSWTSGASLNEGRAYHPAVLLPNGKVLVSGGQASIGYLSSVELYNSTANSWATMAYSPPRITSITTLNNGAKFDGDIINFTVTFSEAVVMTGTPRISLDVGGTTYYATATTRASSATHNFRYIVGGAESDTNGITMSSPIDLDGGTILSSISHNPSGLTFTAPDISGIAINYSGGATVVSVTPPANGTYRAGYPLDFVVTFSESVIVTGYPVIPIDVGGQILSAWVQRTSESTTVTFRLIAQQDYEDLNGIELGNYISLINTGSIVTAATGDPVIRGFDSIATPGILIANKSSALPMPRIYQTETILADGRLLVAGGYLNPGGAVTDAVHIYDPVADSWTLVAPLNTARAHHQAALLNDGRVIVAGGTDLTGGAYPAFNSTEIYDPVANTWTPVTNMNVGSYYAASVLLNDGRFIVIAGRGAAWSFLDTVQIYDPVANTWTTKAPLTGGAQAQHAVSLQGDGKVFVYGGLNWGVPAPDEIVDPNL